MRAKQYLRLTEGQEERLGRLLAQGWTALRVIDNGVEKLTLTKPATRRRQRPAPATSHNVAERDTE